MHNRKKISEIDAKQKDWRNIWELLSNSMTQWIKLRTYIDDQDKINLKFNECIQYEHLLHHMNYVTPIVESCIEKGINKF